MISAFLFDMDGVIVDSNPVHLEAWREYTKRFAVEMTEAMEQEMYGKRNDMIIRDYLGQDLTDAEVFAHGAAKEALYREKMAPQLEEHIVPGLREFLERHCDIPKAVATNAERANLDFALDGAGLRAYFSAAVDGLEVKHPKPAPDIYLRAAKLLDVTPTECVVFEDSHSGVAAGLAAGMRVVGITTTYADLPGASVLVRDFSDPALEAWLAG